MEVSIFNDDLNDKQVVDAYSEYLQKHVEACSYEVPQNTEYRSTLMAYDEFKDYHILKQLGRDSEFAANMAKDLQYMTFANNVYFS